VGAGTRMSVVEADMWRLQAEVDSRLLAAAVWRMASARSKLRLPVASEHRCMTSFIAGNESGRVEKA
jgi:hypothetical protein